jgi:hypothetical protein
VAVALAACAVALGAMSASADAKTMVPAASLAPQLATGDVASAWQFPVPDWNHSNKEEGRVDDIAEVGGVAYIGGDFTQTSDHSGHTVARSYLAAENLATGALTAWDPSLNGRVYALATSPDNSLLYVGGSFTKVNGQSYPHLVAFDLSTGQISPALPSTSINGTVKAITQAGSDIYIGGAFTNVGGQSHQRLAKLSPNASAKWAVNPSWKASANDEVRDLIGDQAGGRVIAAGWFTNINGSKSQSYLASISTTSGATLPWANHPTSPVLDIARSGSRLYAAMGGPGGTALAYDITTGSRLWYYMTDGNVQAVTTVDGWPVFGMHGDYVAPKVNSKLSEYGNSKRISRHKVFELSPDGALQSWAPALETTQGVLGVWALDGSSGTLAVGGDFTEVNRAQQARFALFPS